ncbi:hypothetical protein [Trichormus variabilis]|uniref:Uncharacterized protein n=1 Tax=Trichormus variabilis SAG 1403-4b TaxID=447716 RepID=A0A433UGI4_ANAVA|nr:hypothetical protein [Trichormus variabilis]MBD2629637.1 hypothetical protein [Trichormus variabilis FACHB-164]RUS92945.1 hypothetical protein DSM107003_46920 [Trichormus variabilis SAG 1403-4b]
MIIKPEGLAKLIDMAGQIATKRCQAIAVFRYNDTYYFVNAYEWENGRPCGQYIITVEPSQNPNMLLNLAETLSYQSLKSA